MKIFNNEFGKGKVLIIVGLTCVLMLIIGGIVVRIQKKNESYKKTSISVKEAKKIVNSNEFILDLEYLTQISPNVASELAKFEGIIFLNGLKQISSDVAKELASGNLQTISLDGLSELSPSVAKELVNSEKLKVLSLNGLKTIDLETAKNLTNFKGKHIIVNKNMLSNLNINVKNIIPKLISPDKL